MPCYSEPASDNEVAISKVYLLLDELETGIPPENYDRVVSRAWGQGKANLDKRTEELCSKLQTVDVTKYSLEMQIWWRDHQLADKRRLEKEIQDAEDERAKQVALSKLTEYERKLLGLK